MADTARTLVKTAKFDHPLAEAVRRSSHTIYEVRHSLGNVHKYAAYEPGRTPFLWLVAQQKDVRITTPPGYNLSFSVTSYSDNQNRIIADQFSRETGVEFNIEPPSQLVELISKTDLIFPLLVQKTPEVLKIWDAVKIK